MTATIATQFIPCSDECMFAKGDECECECGGNNHKVGTNGLLPAEYATVTRTRAGRLINPHFADKSQYELAVWFQHLQDEEGMTRKEIAKQCGVSAPTVRRYILRLTLAEELAEGVYEDEEAYAA